MIYLFTPPFIVSPPLSYTLFPNGIAKVLLFYLSPNLFRENFIFLFAPSNPTIYNRYRISESVSVLREGPDFSGVTYRLSLIGSYRNIGTAFSIDGNIEIKDVLICDGAD